MSFSSLLEQAPVKCRERRVLRYRRPSALPAVHGSVRDSWSFAGRGSLSTAYAITCVASFIVAEERVLQLSPRWPTEHAPMAPLVARSPSVPSTRASNGGWGETSAASTSILWGRPHAFVMPMNRSEYFRVSPRDEQGRKSSCRIDAGPHAPDGQLESVSPRVRVGCPSRLMLAGRSPSVST